MQNEKKIKRSLSSDSNQVVLKNSCPSLQLGVVTSSKLEMLCRLAARNQCLMFLQFHPSYVDTHGVNVDARGVIATACNWDQIFMCYLLATVFFAKMILREIIQPFLVTPTYTSLSPYMPYIHIQNPYKVYTPLYTPYKNSSLLPSLILFTSRAYPHIAALFNSLYFIRISSYYQKYFHTLPA